ncbi:type II toxin-antitoxin system HipA family toxin, partial [Thiolapillus sp.]|uniref:type II toxin-antitoxin system HipA family toxin n=1 Tax=Thiolapillus sp. TaxID=2017437 RepID=UPI003AF4E60C
MRAGELVAVYRDNGAIDGQFRYLSSYLDDPEAFPLDPVNLPLVPGPQDVGRPQAGVHGVFEDALPDDWGRRMLCRQYGLSDHQARPPHLLSLMRGGGMGALLFAREHCPVQETVERPPMVLQDVARAALDFEKGELKDNDPLLPYLYGVGTSPGGARPKFLFAMDDGKHFLVKLPSLRDTVSPVPIEAACLATAADCGFSVARSRLLDEGLA